MKAELLLAHYERVADAPDAVDRLRSLILDLAVRGKLLPQKTNSENVTKKYLKEASSDLLPQNWRLLNFEEHCDIQGGNQPPKSQFIDEPREGYVQLFQIRDLGERPVPTYIPLGSTNRFCKEGEILIGRYGASVGKIFWAQNGAYNVAMAKFIWPEDAWISTFVFLLLKSQYLQATLASATRSAQAGFNKGDLAAINFPLPPIAEQHRIVAKVDELMALCDGLEAARAEREATRDRLAAASLARLSTPDPVTFQADARFALNILPALTTRPDQIKQLRQAILNLAVRGALTSESNVAEDAPSTKAAEKAQKPYKIAPSWRWTRMDEIVKFNGGSQPPKSTFVYEPREGYTRLVQIRDFKSDAYMTFVPSEKANRPFKESDVMIGRYGPPVFQILRGLSGTYNVALMKAEPKTTELANEFLFFLLQESRIHDEVVKESERTAGQTGVRLPLLNAFLVGLPPLAEQHRIVAKIDALMNLCDQLESSLGHAATTRQRLLDALLAEALTPVEIRTCEEAA
jgi:type I restriction enzyme S subunit